jgi:YD repeat-containing protein
MSTTAVRGERRLDDLDAANPCSVQLARRRARHRYRLPAPTRAPSPTATPLPGSQVTGSSAKIALPDAISGLVYNDANRLTSRAGTALSYDDDGNLTGDGTTTYNWDARGQLTSLSRTGLSAAFRYNAVGERDWRTVNGTSTGTLNDAGDPIAELNSSGGDPLRRPRSVRIVAEQDRYRPCAGSSRPWQRPPSGPSRRYGYRASTCRRSRSRRSRVASDRCGGPSETSAVPWSGQFAPRITSAVFSTPLRW